MVIAARDIHALGGKPQHPTDISRRDKMPGGTHDVCSQYLPLGKCFLDSLVRRTHQTLAEGPLRTVVVLRLDSAQPLHHIGWFLEIRRREALVLKSLTGN